MSMPIGEWLKRGYVPAYERKLSAQEIKQEASLLLPEGTYGPAFLTPKNYFVIKDYNFSDLYVLFVGHLSDRIADARPFEKPWSKNTQLRTERVEAMQRTLTERGLYRDKIDGKAGMLTRAARRRLSEGQRPEARLLADRRSARPHAAGAWQTLTLTSAVFKQQKAGRSRPTGRLYRTSLATWIAGLCSVAGHAHPAHDVGLMAGRPDLLVGVAGCRCRVDRSRLRIIVRTRVRDCAAEDHPAENAQADAATAATRLSRGRGQSRDGQHRAGRDSKKGLLHRSSPVVSWMRPAKRRSREIRFPGWAPVQPIAIEIGLPNLSEICWQNLMPGLLRCKTPGPMGMT